MTSQSFDLRKARVAQNISQHKFSNIVNISQAKLSAFELGKGELTENELKKVQETLNLLAVHEITVSNKKKITKLTSSKSIIEERPRRNYKKTIQNDSYLKDLQELSNNFAKEVKKDAPNVVSFFAGCGGLCYGLKAAGFNIVATNELVEEYKNIYRENFPNVNFLPNDVKKITKEDIENLMRKYPKIDMLAGGPPCQGFSLAGKRNVGDERNSLFQYYLTIAEQIKPKIILMENVRLLTTMRNPNGGLIKDDITAGFGRIGYDCNFFVVNASNYGVPQNRERILFIGVRKDLQKNPQIAPPIYGENISLFTKRIKYSFGDAVSDLEFIESGEFSKTDIYHKAVNHPEHVLRWLYDVPEGKSAHQNADKKLRPPSGYNTTYKRQVWDKPASTITTNFSMISGGNNVHPIATRALTIREALRIQSFPDNFKLTGTSGVIHTVIGNAVPPLLAYRIGLFLKENYNL